MCFYCKANPIISHSQDILSTTHHRHRIHFTIITCSKKSQITSLTPSSVQLDQKMSVPAFGEADIFLGRRVCGCVHFVREGVGRCVAFGVHVDAGR